MDTLLREEEIIDIESVKTKGTAAAHDSFKRIHNHNGLNLGDKTGNNSILRTRTNVLAPLVYIYEETKKMRWLISRGSIIKQLNIQQHEIA
ncbi:MAG: hypothetical protein QXZ09_05105 [Candidatus Methanomethylicaceae archaeon]